MGRARRRAAQVGSVVMLVPAAVLVLVILGAISVDAAVVFLAHRQLASRTAAAATDIAALAVADEALYGDGGVRLSQDGADRLVALAFHAGARPPGFESVSAVAEVEGHDVTVRAEARVVRVFARGVPGVARSARVTATSRATAARS